jgi:DNA ligase-1
MLFYDFVLLCEAISSEQKRNQKKLIFTNFIRSHGIDEVKSVLLLYDIIEKNSFQINMQEKNLIALVALFFNFDSDVVYDGIRKYGDLSLFIHSLSDQKQVISGFSVQDVIVYISRLAAIQGKHSVDKKRDIIIDFWRRCHTSEISYFIKIILGKMNIGLSSKSIIDIFCDIAREDGAGKDIDVRIQYALGVCYNLGLLATYILEKKYDLLDTIIPIPGNYILAQSAELYLKDKVHISDLESGYYVQPKLDGFRLQMHIAENSVTLFSRNGIDVSDMYPELIVAAQSFKKVNNIQSIILDGEVLAYDFDNNVCLDFQITAKRKRKYDVDLHSTSHRVKYIVFDLLYYNGLCYLNHDYRSRFANLGLLNYDSSIDLIENKCVSSVEQIDLYYKNVGVLFEGIMIKKAHSLYLPGKRSQNWLKYKNIQKDSLEDSIDVVILGYWYAKGQRHKKQVGGSFLVGYYDPHRDAFVTLAQVGTGGAVGLWQEIFDSIDGARVEKIPDGVLINPANLPDVFVTPKLVISLKADCVTTSKDHSSGYSLRFPRLLSIRYDKNPYMTYMPAGIM